jgi:hypothetical protein
VLKSLDVANHSQPEVVFQVQVFVSVFLSMAAKRNRTRTLLRNCLWTVTDTHASENESDSDQGKIQPDNIQWTDNEQSRCGAPVMHRFTAGSQWDKTK